MQFSEEAKKIHANLSVHSLSFLEYVERHPECLRRSSFPTVANATRAGNLMVRYPMQCWPMFIDPQAGAEMERVAAGLCRLVKSVPERFLENDSERFEGFYGLRQRDAVLIAQLIRDVQPIDGLMARGDFVLDSRGLQCLEVNLSANLGGWESPAYASVYTSAPAIAGFVAEAGLDLSFRNTPRGLFAHLVDDFMAHCRFAGEEINTVIVRHVLPDDPWLPPDAPEFWSYLTAEYRTVLKRRDPALTGTVSHVMYADLAEREGYLWLGDRPVHIVIEHCEGYVARPVFVAWLNRTVNVYNGPLGYIMSDKRNLALLSEYQDSSDYFDPEERELLQRHLPWTRSVQRGYTRWQGFRSDLMSLLRQKRESFVLKPCRGFRGEGVAVGRLTAPEAWEKVVEEAFATGTWVAQEYVESFPFQCQTGEEGASDHDVIWGLFTGGKTWDGAFLRVMARQGSRGVVNSAQGAQETIVFEAVDKSTAAGTQG